MLLRAGGFEVVLTRDADEFVSLERRVALAHRAGADVFLSLHADALSGARARGASVYTLSDSASDAASAALAERHNRADILAGVDLSGKDDVVADVLMDLARMETQPRADHLARCCSIHFAPRTCRSCRGRSGMPGFSVLKAPDIPSVLIELGFLSSPRDLKNLRDAAGGRRWPRPCATRSGAGATPMRRAPGWCGNERGRANPFDPCPADAYMGRIHSSGGARVSTDSEPVRHCLQPDHPRRGDCRAEHRRGSAHLWQGPAEP